MSYPIPGAERFSGIWICYWLILKKGMSHFKDNEKGLETVSDKLETYCKKRETEGIKEGSATAKRENAKRMIADSLPLEKVAEYSGLPLSEVTELANKKAD